MGKKFLGTLALVLILAVALGLSYDSVWAAGQSGEYLNYQEPKPAMTSWVSTLAYLFSLLVTFAAVLALAYFTSRFLGQKMGRVNSGGDHRIVVTLPMGANRSVNIVEIAGKYLVLGVTEHNISLLQEINDPQEIEKLKATSYTPPNNQFEAVFQQQLGSLRQMSQKFPAVFGNYNRQDNESEREKR